MCCQSSVIEPPELLWAQRVDLQPEQQRVSQIKCYLRKVITPAVLQEHRNEISWARDGERERRRNCLPSHMLLVLSLQQLDSPRLSSPVADKTSVEEGGFLEISSVFLSLPDTKSKPQRQPPEAAPGHVCSAWKKLICSLWRSVYAEEDVDERSSIKKESS